MNENGNHESGARIGGIAVAALMVLAGVVTLIDTQAYSDMDSKVFPRAAAIALIIFALGSIVNTLLGSGGHEGFGQGSWWRRLLLVGAMLAGCIAMPITGFLPAAIIAFAGSLLAAMHDRWRWQSALIFPIASLVIIIAFHSLFRYGLNVPLP